MIYQRSYTIEQRLESLLCLIRGGRHTAATLAEALGVSVPTVSRCLTALRDRGHDIVSARDAQGCYYRVTENSLRGTARETSVGGHHATL